MQNKKKTCPHCRTEGFESVVNKAVIREINEFHVKCTNHEKGCGWVGELGDLKQHIESENGCGYVTVKCNFSGWLGFFTCNHECMRQSLAKHQKTCKYRRYKCEYCGKVDTYDAIAGEGKIFLDSDGPCGKITSNHYSSCEQYPVECPNKCGEKAIKRNNIPYHRKLCPLERLHCPFRNVGCSSEMLQRDIDTHCHTSMQAHLLLMVKSHDKLLCKNKELTKRVMALENKQ